METNLNNNKRVFTVACRANTAILTDSKKDENGINGLSKVESTSSQLACLIVLNEMLAKIPDVKLSSKVAFMLPSNISFLSFKKTRNEWITNETKKNGEVLSEEILKQVTTLDALCELQKGNIEFFDQRAVKSPYYMNFIKGTWAVLNKMVPRESVEEKYNTVNANSAF